MNVSNLKPAELSPVYTSKIVGPFDTSEYMKDVLCKNLRQPIVPGVPARITTNSGNDIDDTAIVGRVASCLGATADIASENWVRELYGMCLLHFNRNTTLSMRNLFAIQAGASANLQEPSPVVMYTEASDVIPTSREFLAGKCDYDKYFATMAFYARVQTLGFYFANESCFDAFKSYVSNCMQTMSATLPNNTITMMGDFQTLTLNQLTESLIIRNDPSQNNHDMSFARLIVYLLMQYTTAVSSAEFGVMPFDLEELFCPTTLVFVNVEKHMHATAKQVNKEWDIIRKSLQNKIAMISNAKLSKLTATYRAIDKIASAAVSSASRLATGRSASVIFRKKAPTSLDLVRWVSKLFNKITNVNRSENSYKCIKMTFNMPNRREPDNFNKMGKSVSTKYRPDIHVYLDTSGSISESNYQDAIMALIKMAKKLNINLYFNSFSDCLSQCVKLHLQGKSVKQIYREFQRIPKVSGGTNYEQIWDYINASKKRERELSLIITDFEYSPPNRYVKHPRNLYYAPCSGMNYNRMQNSAKEFIESMRIIDPDCRSHILM